MIKITSLTKSNDRSKNFLLHNPSIFFYICKNSRLNKPSCFIVTPTTHNQPSFFLIRHLEQFKQGIATLRFTIPKTARANLLRVRVTIRLGSQSTTRISTFPVH